MAPDAVVGLVERAAQVGAEVGERETLASAQVAGLDGEHAHAVLVVLAGVAEQALRIDLAGQLEQHVAGMAVPARLGGHCPRAVAARHGESLAGGVARCGRGAVVGLGALPVEHGARERQLVERLADQRFDLVQRRVGVEAGEFARRQLHRLAFDELQLDLVERVERAVRIAQRGERVVDAEQPADEGVDVRAELDQQRRLVAGGERRSGIGGLCAGRLTRAFEPLRERGVARAQRRDEGRVDAAQSFGRVQVFEAQSVGEVERGSQGNSFGVGVGQTAAAARGGAGPTRVDRLIAPDTGACRSRSSSRPRRAAVRGSW